MSASAFSAAHRAYVKSLYKRSLKNALDWTIRRDLWRAEALQIRASFEANRNVHDPRALAEILEKAEARLAARLHVDPVIREAPLFVLADYDTQSGNSTDDARRHEMGEEPATQHGACVRPLGSRRALAVVNHMTVACNILPCLFLFHALYPPNMNYIRGAVNAISAPYQYYKELPPINPSTLTGAIDVIVVQRPSDKGDTELVCSPFHVRFGKWQVLRPGEKKVNVFVNGKPIPFSMKIGEAGEAFFVFETDDDVPDDLITSPIIQPTVPGKDAQEKPFEPPVDSERFGSKPDEGKREQKQAEEHFELKDQAEPDFLNLDGDAVEETPSTPKQRDHTPQFLRRTSSGRTINSSSTPDSGNNNELSEQDQKVDAALNKLAHEAHVPEVEYLNNVTLDMEGYKSGYHDRERSDSTVRSSTPIDLFRFPKKTNSHEQSPPVHPLPHTQSSLHTSGQSLDASSSASPPASPSSSGSPTTPQFHTHPFRATSEPPPDLDTDDAHTQVISIPAPHDAHLRPQLSIPGPVEYSWEWGAFPQPSPMKVSFGKGGRIEGATPGGSVSRKSRMSDRKGRLMSMALPPTLDAPEDAENLLEAQAYDRIVTSGSGLSGRSKSVPPRVLDGFSQPGRGGSREYKEFEDADAHEEERRGRGHPSDRSEGAAPIVSDTPEESNVFGSGGILSASLNDKTTFILLIQSKKVTFQLSLVPLDEAQSSLNSKDEVESNRVFDRYRVEWSRLLSDDSIVHDPRLVICWIGDQYITRRDGSPLFASLVHWRENALRKHAQGDDLRPVSPPLAPEHSLGLPHDDKIGPKLDNASSKPPVQDPQQTPTNKPTSTSWVAWWSRSRRNASTSNAVLDTTKDSSSTSLPLPSKASTDKLKAKTGSTPMTPVQHAADGDTVPTLNIQEATPTRPTAEATPSSAPPAKKFAKTLRLTSDQLKSLDLKPGANAITFSLSSSGAIAATARIFVWEHTDLVVISDIDGTITKSDGLGHVFAMIGRDWTHLGVAKLYTDIVRNGYKIMYLTSRAIGQADATRDYLKGIKQNNYQLPEGPVIMSPDRLMTSLHREVILRKPEVFKMACLRDIQRLFGSSAKNPFYAGFGNRITDALSYRSVNVPSARIFTIDSTGEVKMELLELAGYKSTYIHMTDLVDQMFPPIHKKWTPEYTDFNYWKTPVQDFPLPDLSPPSPALSARSDTSNGTLARLRNFSLGGNAASPSRNQQFKKTTTDTADGGSNGSPYQDAHLRQMSSFEKLTSTLGFMSRVNNDASRRSVSPSSGSSYFGSDDEDEEVGVDGQKRKRVRRRSMTSMPGTLDERHFGLDDSDEEDDRQFIHNDDNQDDNQEGDDGYDGAGDEEETEEDQEEAFDDDLLAAGEMANVPFL